MSGYTKGPWVAKPFGVIVGGDAHQYTNGKAQSQIAMAMVLQNSSAPDVMAEREANARLIAAAPDLLGQHEANLADLWLLRKAIQAGDSDRELLIRVADMERRTEEAIAKATRDTAANTQETQG